MSADRYREWDAAYVLGALSPEERLEFEAHLEQCPDCTAAVAESAGIPGVLRRLDAATAVRIRDLPASTPPQDEAHDDRTTNVAHIAGRIRRRRSLVSMAAAAAVVTALGGGVGGGIAITTALGGGSTTVAATTTELHPVGGSDVSATLTMRTIAEGTRLDWHCSYPEKGDWRGPTAYRLVVQIPDGSWRTVATWSASGKGADGLSTVTSIARQDIRAVEIRLPDSKAALAAVRL
jgi:hypothetical protein